MWALRSCWRNLVSGFLGECLQSGGIRVGQHCIFVGSAFRAFAMLQCQGHPIAGSRLWCYARLRSLAGSSSHIGHQDGRLWKCNNLRRWGLYKSAHPLMGLPVPAGFGVVAASWNTVVSVGYSVFRFRCPYRGIQWCRRRNGTTCGHGENRYTYHVHAAPYRSYRSDVLGQTAGKSLVGIEHLLHAGEGIDIQYPGTQLVERQMNARDTRNTIPVETGLLPATGGKKVTISSGFPVRICMLPCAR